MEQLSLLEWGRLAAPGRSDADVVADLAHKLIARLGLEPPIDHRIVASYQGVARIRTENLPWAGCLIQEDGQLVIQLRAWDTPRRQRFTAFHEVGHTFLPGFSVGTQYRCDPAPGLARRSPDEVLCDVAASELLFPRSIFVDDLEALPFGLDSVQSLAERYEGSLEATARRFVDLWPEPALLVVLELRTKPSERGDPDAEPRLRVAYAHGKGSWPFIPRYKSVGDGSLLARALYGEVVQGPSNLDGLVAEDGVAGELSARLFPHADADGLWHHRVIALYRRPPFGGTEVTS